MKLATKWPEILVKWPYPSFVLFVSKQSLGVYFHFRLFGNGNGTILAIILFCCLFILENKLNYDDEIMVMQKV